MNTEKLFNIQDYIAIGLRRKWYIIIPVVIAIFASFGVYKYLPKVYKTTTQILVQPQRIPESYVRSTLTDPVSEQLNTLSQEILSRTRLEGVINEFKIFSDLLNKIPMEEIVEMMRRKIEVRVQRQNSFSISFEHSDPRIAMSVTNKLASLFIEENLKFRESRAEGTSDFISKELQTVEDSLKKKENEVRLYKERNMGQLPQQLEANLRILERLQQQIKTTSENLRASEDRMMIVQNQIEQLRERQQSHRELYSTLPSSQSGQSGMTSRENTRMEQVPENALVTQLNTLKKDLANAQSKYTENHPDVIDLKSKIARLEPKVVELLKKQTEMRAQPQRTVRETNLPPPAPIFDPATERLLTQYTEQYNETRAEAKRFREEIKTLKDQIAHFQRRVEDTPKKEQEMLQMTRDYDLIKNNYQSLMDKKIQAQMSENLERKQQGETFRILDPARFPEKPFKPNRNSILLMGAMIGLAIGLGLTWFRESMDQSFHSVSEVESYLEIPVLATIPNLKEEEKKAA